MLVLYIICMRQPANTTPELVPKPQGQGQARPQESCESIEHGLEHFVWWHVWKHASQARTICTPPRATADAHADEPGIPPHDC